MNIKKSGIYYTEFLLIVFVIGFYLIVIPHVITHPY